jgi:hypothetical protein
LIFEQPNGLRVYRTNGLVLSIPRKNQVKFPYIKKLRFYQSLHGKLILKMPLCYYPNLYRSEISSVLDAARIITVC